MEVTRNGALKSEVKHQACKAAKLSICLNDTIYQNKYLRAEPQVRIYKSDTRPVLTHATEASAVTYRAKQIINLQE